MFHCGTGLSGPKGPQTFWLPCPTPKVSPEQTPANVRSEIRARMFETLALYQGHSRSVPTKARWGMVIQPIG